MRQPFRRFPKPFLFIFGLSFCFASCAVYTVNKTTLEEKLNSSNEHPNYKGLSKNSISQLHKGKAYNNNIDTLACLDQSGTVLKKHVEYGSKVRIVTNKDKSVKLYAKTLYIWKDQFLVGECVVPSIHGGTVFFPVKLSDIARIEVIRR